MKTYVVQSLIGISIILIAIPALSFYHADNEISKNAILPAQVVVKLKSNIEDNSHLNKSVPIQTALAELETVDGKYGVTDLRALFIPPTEGHLPSGLRNIFIIEVPAGVDMNELAAEYNRLDNVEYAHPDYMAELYETPNDPLYSHQWALHNTGQGFYHVHRYEGYFNDVLTTDYGFTDADIDAHEVFANPPDKTCTVIVAIIDTGVDIDHPDLIEKIWHNPGEIPDNELDDDHNGFIDDYYGWDFTGDNTYIPPLMDNDPTDEYGHGTHCAGIVVAAADNNLGVAGIIDDCRIMPIKFYPVMLSSYAARAIIYAADNGADVISMSFGYPWPVQILEDALDYARMKGVVLCAAAGNDEAEYLNYPAGYQQVITVGATDSRDEVTHFSTYGNHLDLCAPGQSILSLRGDLTDMYEAYNEPNVHIIDEIYYLASGTSMACPHVAGVAAYLRAVSPGLSPARVQEILQITSDDLEDPYGDGEYLPGWDKYSGHGRVNLSGALASTPRLRAKITSPRQNELHHEIMIIRGIADGDGFQDYTLEYGPGTLPNTWTPIHSSTSPITNGILATWNTEGLNGKYTLRLRVGETNTSRVTVNLANQCLASISSPTSIDTIRTWADIEGSAVCMDFTHYRLEYRYGPTGEWQTIGQFNIPVYDGELAVWPVSGLADGIYTIRLTLFSQEELLAIDSVDMIVQSPFSSKNGWKVAFDTSITNMPTYGDFDHDGAYEIVIGTESGVSFFNPDGTPKTEGVPQPPNYDFRITPAVGDLDGDSIDDLVMVGVNGAVGTLYVYPSSEPAAEIELLRAPVMYLLDDIDECNYPTVALKDINSDGRDEILYYMGQKKRHYLYFYTTEYELQLHSIASYLTYFPADLDNDGIDEFYTPITNMIYQTDLYGVISKGFDLRIVIDDQMVVSHISAVDIDADEKLELIVMAYVNDNLGTHWIYAFDENLILKPGWPHDTGINSYLVPPGPIFADIDRDDNLEYLMTAFELNQAHIYAWHLDGFSYAGDSSVSILAGTFNPGILSSPLLADITGDSFPELIAHAKRDVYHMYKVERLIAWDRYGQMLDGWPLIIIPDGGDYLTFGIHTPACGDIDNDGFVDIIMTTAANELVFLNFEGIDYNPKYAPMPFWRYSRRMNNVRYFPGISTRVDTVAGDPHPSIPDKFSLDQNYPNPFNASTTIRFSISTRSEVEFKVINILGQTIENENLGVFEAGIYTISWSAQTSTGSNLPSGVYFYQITAGDIKETRKMVLLK
jgi:subtilisin family serine protease